MSEATTNKLTSKKTKTKLSSKVEEFTEKSESLSSNKQPDASIKAN